MIALQVRQDEASPWRPDLHSHSSASDGVLAPAAVAERAAANGVSLWALTDHDTLAGIEAARSAAVALGLPFVAGVEVSVTWAGATVHIVGLGVDPAQGRLAEGLAQVRAGRFERAREMARRFDAQGIPGTLEGALAYVQNPEMISRTHFARCLVERGVCGTMQRVFERFLADGKPMHVPVQWATLGQAVAWIRSAGGQAVIAHPGRYRYSELQFEALYAQFRDLGGVGIEVVTGSHAPWQYAHYAQVARRFGFRASVGSDFHAPGEGRVDLGGLPPLPPDLTPIWQDWL